MRVHRILGHGEWDGVRQLIETKRQQQCASSWVFDHPHVACGPSPPAQHTWTADDAARVAALRAWARSSLGTADAPLVVSLSLIHI